jgi:hypothetical protein
MSATLADATIIDAVAVEARKQQKRAKKLEQKRVERERRAAAKLAREIAEFDHAWLDAHEDEKTYEFMATSVLRGAIVTPDGRMLRGPIVRIIAGRPMIGAEFAFAPRRSRRAAVTLRLDWQEVGAGLNVAAVDYLRSGGAGSGSGAGAAMIGQIATRTRLDGALAHLGDAAHAIGRTVLDCIPIPIWANEENARRERKALDPLLPDVAVAYIAAGLARLADYYWPPRDNLLGSGSV